MKKLFLFLIALMFITLNTTAQQQIIVGKNYVNPNEVTLVAERGTSTTIKFDLNELNLIEVVTDYGLANKISSANATIMLEAGSPELFYLPTAIIIPDLGSAELDIVYGEYTDVQNIEIAPSKGNLLRSIDPSTVPYVKGEVYNQDAFFPGTLANINETFIIRDVRGLTLFSYPVQYNPVTKTLRIYSEITVTVNYTNNPGENEFTTQKRNKSIDPAFIQMYNNLFINYNNLNRAYPTEEAGELLIICHTAFMDEMQPYVDWKRTIGRKTTIVPTSETGTTAAGIKTYIQDYYNNPDNNLAYVLFVGDNPQIPAHTASGNVRSDIFYGQLVSTPYLDILIGRMSAENVAHVQTQVERTIHYERDLTTSDAWQSVAMGVAHNEGPGHDGGEYDHIHMENIRTRLLAYGYDPVHQDYTSAPGIPNTNAAQISQRINAGLGMINYCNHGYLTGWSVANYNSSHVNALQNAGKLPYVFSVACNNGEFQSGTCFAEAWMRANQDGQPTGAIATFMATISISWHPPMTAQDEFVNICMDLPSPYGSIQPGIKRTIAGAMLNASQKMRLIHGNSAHNDYNSWLVFGDPTLMFRTKTPEEMTISHLSTIPLGTSEFFVECDAEGALATISYIDEDDEVIILGTAVVADGIAEIIFDEPATATELTLAITGFNKVTYLSSIFVEEDIVLPVPLNLTYIVENANHVVLSWNIPEERDGLNVQGYNIYRNNAPIPQNPVEEGVTYTDIVPQNGEYKYVVTALYGAALESNPSNLVTVIIDGMCIPFSNNIALEQMKTEGYNILVSWTAPNYEGTELAGYNIYRDAQKINTELVPATGLSFLDENLEPETEYCYQVEVVYNDCGETFKSGEECLTVLSINDFSGTQAFSIFPNPANGNVTIEGAGLNRVEIYDVQGRRLAEYNNVKGNLQTNVSKYESGIYFVKMYSENNQMITKRLVIMK